MGYAISNRLGHASIKTTNDIYGHLFQGQDDAAANRLDALMTDIDQTDDDACERWAEP